MDLLALLLGAVNDKGVSVTKGTLEVVLIVLAIVLVVILIFNRRRPWPRP